MKHHTRTTLPPMPDRPFQAATWSERRGKTVIVWLRPETTIDEGSFILTGHTYTDDTGNYPEAEYHPGRDGTHTPVGPAELEALGLRDHIPHPGEDGAPE